MMSDSEQMSRLRAYLDQFQPGLIEDATHLACLLADCWDEIGNDYSSMAGYKLLRMEDVAWSPPVLRFVIERHGGMCMGSSRAELQHWEVNLQKRTRALARTGHRQICAMEPRLNVKPIAEELARTILAKQPDDRLKWNKDGSVKLLTGKVFLKDSAVKQTLEGRRKRLREALARLLAPAGWSMVKASVYEMVLTSFKEEMHS